MDERLKSLKLNIKFLSKRIDSPILPLRAPISHSLPLCTQLRIQMGASKFALFDGYFRIHAFSCRRSYGKAFFQVPNGKRFEIPVDLNYLNKNVTAGYACVDIRRQVILYLTSIVRCLAREGEQISTKFIFSPIRE